MRGLFALHSDNHMKAFPHFSPIPPEVIQFAKAADTDLVDPACAVYTNRDLDLSLIEWVGFDMDYTLANYHKEPMELLQYQLTLEYLIKNRGYPAEIRQLNYDHQLIIRGLVVDKPRGHLLKMDAHGQVWYALHGKRSLTKEEIDALYSNRKIKVGSPQYASLDTLFAMPEACLYCNIIDFFETRRVQNENLAPIELPNRNFNTTQLFEDVRFSIDQIHSDGSLKSIITQDLPTYINGSPDIALTLHKLRSVGKKLFLLTNSYWRYTQTVMTYLLDKRLPEYASWRAYFDLVVVGSQKPAFFTDRNPFFEVDTSPTAAVNEVDTPTQKTIDTELSRHKVYLGGNIRDFEQRLHARGDQILYIGDHIYGDIVRSKKESLWRTCLIVDELHDQIQLTLRHAKEFNRVTQLETDRFKLDAMIGYRRSLLAHIDTVLSQEPKQGLDKKQIDLFYATARVVRREQEQAKNFLRELSEEILNAQTELERLFHPLFGRLFNQQNELSRFGAQVAFYACIYTSNITNLLQYSPIHVFRSSGDMMTHDRILLNSVQVHKV